MARNCHGRLITVLVCTAVLPVTIHGGDFNDKPYLLRFALALSRAANYAPASGLQATAAYPAGWSVNPAADDLSRYRLDEELVDRTSVSLTHLNAFTTSGAWFTASAVSAGFRLGDIGTVPFTYARTDTVSSTTNEGLENPLRSNEFFAGHSWAPSEYVAFGWETRILTAEIQEETLRGPAGFPTRSDVNLFGADLALGTRLQLTPLWSWGLLGALSWASTTTDVRNLVPLPLPAPGFPVLPADSLLASEGESVLSRSVRMGIGFTPSDFLGLYSDIGYYFFEAGPLGSIEATRWLGGLELQLTEALVASAGICIDDQADVTLSAALISTHLACVTLQIAYQYNAFPEVAPEFGEFGLVSMSAAGQF